jgi:uncharacterized protein (TIGR03067 family)
MRRILTLSLLLALAALPVRAADEPDPEPTPSDARKLQGNWEIISVTRNGRSLKLPGRPTMTLEKAQMTMSLGGKATTGTWKVDPRKKPRHIELKGNLLGGPAGIYKLDKDELTIGFSMAGNDRPRDFASAQLTLVLKRKK